MYSIQSCALYISWFQPIMPTYRVLSNTSAGWWPSLCYRNKKTIEHQIIQKAVYRLRRARFLFPENVFENNRFVEIRHVTWRMKSVWLAIVSESSPNHPYQPQWLCAILWLTILPSLFASKKITKSHHIAHPLSNGQAHPFNFRYSPNICVCDINKGYNAIRRPCESICLGNSQKETKTKFSVDTNK